MTDHKALVEALSGHAYRNISRRHQGDGCASLRNVVIRSSSA